MIANKLITLNDNDAYTCMYIYTYIGRNKISFVKVKN